MTARELFGAAAIAAAVFAGGSLRTVPGVVGAFHDDAVYATTAEALADGEGYTLRNLPGQPPQTKYPILFPAVLSLAARTTADPHERLVRMQETTTAVSALAMALAWLCCIRIGAMAPLAAFLGVLVAASAPNVLYYCAQPLSELPFLALAAVALWTAGRRLQDDDASALGDFAMGVLLGLPFLCRGAGIVLPIAFAIVLVARKSSTGVLVRMLAGTALVALPWIVWSMQAASGADAVAEYQTDYLGWWSRNASLTVVASNLYKAVLATAQIPLEPLARALYAKTTGAAPILFAIGLLPWLTVLKRCTAIATARQGAAIATARRGAPIALLPVTLVVYLALVCLWPWPPDRFLVPLLPFLFATFFDELGLLLSRVGGARAATAVAATIAIACSAANVSLLARYREAIRTDGYPHFVLPSEPVPWSSYEAAFAFLREHTKEGDVLAAGFDTMTALYTGRATVRPFAIRPLALFYGEGGDPIGTVDDTAKILETYGARYLLATPIPAYAEEGAFYDLVSAIAEQRPSLLRPVWQAPGDPRFVVFEVASGRNAS